jgi:extracellular matrix protein 14
VVSTQSTTRYKHEVFFFFFFFNAMKYFGDYVLGNNGIERFADEQANGRVHEAEDELSLDELRRRRLRR